MHLQQSQNRIFHLLSTLVVQIEGIASLGRTDINQIAENVLIPVFEEVYGYTELQNLNFSEDANFPGIDLGDKKARVAIQVTSTPDSEKVKHTLLKFVEHKLYRQYDHLIIYILTRKQKSYSGAGYDEIIQSTFTFDKSRDIRDYSDLTRDIAALQIDQVRRIENILEANIGDKNIPLFGKTYEPQVESVYLNLLEVSFPEMVYVAELTVHPDDSQHNVRRKGRRFTRKSSYRDAVRAELNKLGLRFSTDYVCHERKIVTFHDLNDRLLPLAHVIDSGTITELSSKEFYSIDEGYENVFKTLLRQCLQQKLYRQRVLWQHEEELFIFCDIEGETVRSEQWYGKKENKREVYVRTMKDNKHDEILNCKHLSFEVQFRRFSDVWFLVIKPDWFFSFDGFRRNFFASDNLRWIKANENNDAVFNQLRFIAYFLKNEQQSNLFVARHTYPFLTFGELVTFDNAPKIDDKEWRPKSTKKTEEQEAEATQEEIDFEL
jgi:hypothetical protein